MLTSTQKKSIARLTREITTPEDDVIHVKIPADLKVEFYEYLDRRRLTVQQWTRYHVEQTLEAWHNNGVVRIVPLMNADETPQEQQP